MNWQWDGSWFGLLCALEHIYQQCDPVPRLSGPGVSSPDLFSPETRAIEIPCNQALARAIWSRLKAHAGLDSAEILRHAFLHEPAPDPSLLISWYQACKRHGPEAAHYHHQTASRSIMAMARRVEHEAHLLCGLLRFQELADGSLYARLDSRHGVLPLMLPHFRARQGSLRWMIHDPQRRWLAVHHQGNVSIHRNAMLEAELPLSLDETSLQALWQCFFQSITIPSRRNPKSQRRLMPMRYRRMLVEKPCGKANGNELQFSYGSLHQSKDCRFRLQPD